MRGYSDAPRFMLLPSLGANVIPRLFRFVTMWPEKLWRLWRFSQRIKVMKLAEDIVNQVKQRACHGKFLTLVHCAKVSVEVGLNAKLHAQNV